MDWKRRELQIDVGPCCWWWWWYSVLVVSAHSCIQYVRCLRAESDVQGARSPHKKYDACTSTLRDLGTLYGVVGAAYYYE